MLCQKEKRDSQVVKEGFRERYPYTTRAGGKKRTAWAYWQERGGILSKIKEKRKSLA